MEERDAVADYAVVLAQLRGLYPRASHDDVMQEAYSERIEYERRGGKVRKPAALLLTIAKRIAAREYGERDRIGSLSIGPEQLLAPAPAPLQLAALREESILLDSALRDLGSRRTSLVVGYYWERRSCSELAVALGYSRSTVKSELCRARRELRRRLVGGYE